MRQPDHCVDRLVDAEKQCRPAEDDEDLFGKLVARELRATAALQRQTAKRRIMSVLYGPLDVLPYAGVPGSVSWRTPDTRPSVAEASPFLQAQYFRGDEITYDTEVNCDATEY